MVFVSVFEHFVKIEIEESNKKTDIKTSVCKCSRLRNSSVVSKTRQQRIFFFFRFALSAPLSQSINYTPFFFASCLALPLLCLAWLYSFLLFHTYLYALFKAIGCVCECICLCLYLYLSLYVCTVCFVVLLLPFIASHSVLIYVLLSPI